MNKQFQKIEQRFKAIQNGDFDEDDIKLLLIEIREKLKKETFLIEVCHFVAHAKRDKGICHKKIDSRYAKLKLVQDQTDKILTPKFIEENKDKPEHFITDALLGYIQTKEIDKTIFELIILNGIAEIDNNLFLKHYGRSKKQIKHLIQKSYKKENNSYRTKSNITEQEFKYLDDLLKFIRGTVSGKPAFTGVEILNDLINGISKRFSQTQMQIDIDKLKSNGEDIIACVLALLHDSEFKLFDGTYANGFLSLHPEKESPKLCLMVTSGKFTIPIITTNLDATNYIKMELDELKKYEFKSLPWNTCIRNKNGKLELKDRVGKGDSHP